MVKVYVSSMKAMDLDLRVIEYVGSSFGFNPYARELPLGHVTQSPRWPWRPPGRRSSQLFWSSKERTYSLVSPSVSSCSERHVIGCRFNSD